MNQLFPGGFHLRQRIKVPGGIDMTQQGSHKNWMAYPLSRATFFS